MVDDVQGLVIDISLIQKTKYLSAAWVRTMN